MHLLGFFYPQEDRLSYTTNQHDWQELKSLWNMHMVDLIQATIDTNTAFSPYSFAQLNHDLAISTQQRGLDKDRISFPRSTIEKIGRILSWFTEQEAQGNDPILILNIPKRLRSIWTAIKEMYATGHISTWQLASSSPDQPIGQSTINGHIQNILRKISSERYSINMAYNVIRKTLLTNPILLNRLNETEKKLLDAMQQQWETDRILTGMLRAVLPDPKANINSRIRIILEKLQAKPPTVGKVLTLLREARGLSETDLGQKIDLTHQAISQAELSQSTRIDTLVKFLGGLTDGLGPQERDAFLIYACNEILHLKTSSTSTTTVALPNTDGIMDTIAGIHRKFGSSNALMKYLESKTERHDRNYLYSEISLLANSRFSVDRFVDLLSNIGLQPDSNETRIALLLLLKEKGL